MLEINNRYAPLEDPLEGRQAAESKFNSLKIYITIQKYTAHLLDTLGATAGLSGLLLSPPGVAVSGRDILQMPTSAGYVMGIFSLFLGALCFGFSSHIQKDIEEDQKESILPHLETLIGKFEALSRHNHPEFALAPWYREALDAIASRNVAAAKALLERAPPIAVQGGPEDPELNRLVQEYMRYKT